MIGLSLRRWLRAAGAVLLLAALLPLYGGVAHATSNTQSAKALSDHECDTSAWHFVITQVASQEKAPSAIQVSWENGDSQTVPLDKYTGKTAHYSTTSNLDSTVTSATATLDDSWDGQFNLSHGPCSDSAPEQCPAGEEMGDDGTCEPKEQECPAGQHMGDDGECVGNGGGHTPVNVCHGTGSGYVFITVDADSADFQGHLMHRTEPVEPRNRDYVGSYTAADGVFHELDGDIDGIEDCPPAEEEPVAPTGGFTTECTAAGALVDLGTLSTGSAKGTFQFVVNGAAQTVASGQQDIAVPGGASLVLKFVPTSGEQPTTMQSGTAPAACQPPVVAPTGSFAASCTATGALVDLGALTEGTSSGGTFQLVVNGVAQAVTSGQQDVVVPGGASLVLRYKPASGAVATLATSMAPAACPASTTPGGGGTTGGATGGTDGETEVEGTKTGNAGSRTPTVGSDTGVQGVKTGSSGVLAATGSAMPAGLMVVLAGMLLLMGAALLRVAVGGRRS